MTRLFGIDQAMLTAVGISTIEATALEAQIRERTVGASAGEVWDAHVHVGQDADGHELDVASLVADLDSWGMAGSVIFPANDPGPDGQFAAANRQVTAAASRLPDRLIPFCRLDPNGEFEASLEHWFAAGARGVKLHPVAQRFRPESESCVRLVAHATQRGLPVLIHAGYGARPLAGPFGALVESVPEARLILAHGGRGDARALRAAFAGHRGIRFDTSLASLCDLVELPPDQLLFGSDRPYGDHASAFQLVTLAAEIAGWTGGQLKAVMGRNLLSWVAP